MSTHARPLAVWLAAADDEVLERLFTARGVRPDASWHDFFDAAEALLESASIERALQTTTAAEAQALLHAARGGGVAPLPRLQELGLIAEDGSLPTPVAQAVLAHDDPPTDTHRADARTADEHPADEPRAAAASSSDDAAALAAERAFTNIAALGDLLLATRESAFGLLASGLVNAAARRRMTDAGLTAENIDPLLALAGNAGLARADDRMLRLTRAGDAWLRRSAAERWAQLATAFRDSLPDSIRTADGGWIPLADWPSLHPWDAAWPARARDLLEQARLLGLVDDDGAEPAWAMPLRTGAQADTAALQRLLPAEVDRVFLQNDLSAIAPGPLAPHLDVRLRSLAERESTAQASSYRFTAESLTRGFGEEEDEASALAFLEELSLTGIPQPLRYLISQTASRHGLVRVGQDAETGRTRVTSIDAHLLEAISVDQVLRPLGLSRDGGGLSTRVGADTVFWALADARYPATLVDCDGSPVSARRELLDDEPASGAPPHAALIARLRESEGPDTDAAWLDRELDAAVRQRSVVVVEVGMPDGSARELTLEASGLGGGRLRGRDRSADVERTLPISSIRSVRVLDAPAAP